jgi:hypothetical protein
MREDDAGSRIPVHDAVQDELDGCSGGIKWVVDERTGDAGRRREWQPGMHEHGGLAAVEFRPQRLERRIAEVFFGIVAEENHPIGPQRVERILEFERAPSMSGSHMLHDGRRRTLVLLELHREGTRLNIGHLDVGRGSRKIAFRYANG